MLIIVGGCGYVGSAIAERLVGGERRRRRHRQRPPVVRSARNHVQRRDVVGSVIDRDVLEQAGIADADGFIAVTRSDNTNLMAVEIATHLYGVRRSVARLFNPDNEEVYRRLGVSYVSSTGAIAKLFLNEFRGALPLHVMFPEDDVSVVDLEVDTEGHGLSVAEFESHGPVRITAVQRDGRVRIPDEREVLQRGDVVTAAVGPSSARRLAPLVRDLEREDVLGVADPGASGTGGGPDVYVVIVGGGRIGRYVARDIVRKGPRGHGHRAGGRPRRVARRGDRGARHRGRRGGPPLPRAGAHGARRRVRRDHARGRPQPRRLPARTHRVRTKRVISRVNDPKNVEIFQVLGIEAVSSTRLISELIENEFSVGELIHLSSLRGGRAEHRRGPHPRRGVRAPRTAARRDRLPDDAVVVLVFRGEETLIPRGGTHIVARGRGHRPDGADLGRRADRSAARGRLMVLGRRRFTLAR
jgi:trk system potassium uptake protein